MPPRQGVSQREIARRMKVTHAAVQKAARTGRIKAAQLPDGSWDPELAEKLWRANTDETKSRNAVSGQPKMKRDPKLPPLPAGAGGDGSDYVTARAQRERFMARLKGMEAAEKAGMMARTSEFKVATSTALRRTYDLLRAQPLRLRSLLVAAATVEEVDRILNEDIDSMVAAIRTLEQRFAPGELRGLLIEELELLERAEDATAPALAAEA
jgi:hypothetical protein